MTTENNYFKESIQQEQDSTQDRGEGQTDVAEGSNPVLYQPDTPLSLPNDATTLPQEVPLTEATQIKEPRYSSSTADRPPQK